MSTANLYQTLWNIVEELERRGVFISHDPVQDEIYLEEEHTGERLYWTKEAETDVQNPKA